MKLNSLLKHKFVEEFEKLLVTDFEKELFVASLRNYCSHGNPLRFHNFAFSMRELLLTIIDRLAPNDKVKKATWYKRESEKFEVTRRQKLKYCAQKYISDDYLNGYVLEDLNDSIKDYLKEFNFFNKYTHISEKHYKACPKQFYEDMKYIIQRSKEVIEEIDSLENIVREAMEDRVQEPVFIAVINDLPNDLDILASRVFVEKVSPESICVTYLEDNGITLDVEGTLYVTQEYGPKDDSCEISENYPFTVTVEVSVNDPNKITVNTNTLSVDTSSWYE